MQGGGGASKEREKTAARQQGQRDNQLANKRQTVGEASVDRRWRSVKRTRDGSGATRGVETTIRQMRGKRGGLASGQRGGGFFKAGGASRQQEVEVVRQEDKRRRWRVVRQEAKAEAEAERQEVTQQPARAS